MNLATRLSRRLTVVLAALVMVLLGAGAAHAYVGQRATIPSYNGATGTATLSSFTSSSYKVSVSFTVRPGSCVYVQAKPVARAALDGDWKRKTDNNCYLFSGTISDSFHLAYDGVKIRFCKDVFGTDPCGSDITLYR